MGKAPPGEKPTVRRRRSAARTMATEAASFFDRLEADERANAYPLTQYQRDPVRYVLERLREPVVMPQQEQMLRALADGIARKKSGGKVLPARVAARSGQKTGKTKFAVWASFWFYECFEGSRVFLCAAIKEQTKRVMWNEVRLTHKACVDRGVDLDGKLALSPEGGLVSTDGSRQVIGVGGRDIEAVAGLSGGNMLTIIDEASHMAESKAQAFAGNTMGGGALVMLSQATRNEGPFFDAFHGQRAFWQLFHLDAEKIAAWHAEYQRRTGKRVPGVAETYKIEEFRQMYGESSPFWILRVKGGFLINELGRGIPMHLIEAAIARWAGGDDDGLLSLGIDPAGTGDDKTGMAIVRGARLVAIFAFPNLTEDEIIAKARMLLQRHRRDGEIPQVCLDVDGPIGSKLAYKLHPIADELLATRPREAFRVYSVKPSTPATRRADLYVRTRDELYAWCGEWMKTAAIPDDPELQVELHTPMWEVLLDGRQRKMSKDDIRAKIGRSPDKADAVELAVWNPAPWVTAGGAGEAPKLAAPPPPRDVYEAASAFDFYEGSSPFEPKE